ncbi:Zn-dependent hydrolase [Streptomyces minutiscleroticus]|uniref:Zn-dependent hydrolase n=1 Tax=Streptomyces minutiscleroticus TaxID=68238 RepID=A0A918NM38_9ACTN|nr:Zn-dependent hydrolase [Streptomyces minutiscleroticus]GGX80181.1 Zn-dependent hydrolase [Streptomyces minutiscleroticus]
MSHTVVERASSLALDIDAERLLRRIEELGRIGADPATGGITRTGFSAADREARAYLMDEARAAGLFPAVDAAGNIVVRRRHTGQHTADRQVLMMGSHLDTVVDGGRLDGAYGVLAALEVLQTLVESGVGLRHEPVAVAFANEEGALFPQPFWGSMAAAGRITDLPEEPCDHQGRPLRNALRLAGGDLDALGSACWPEQSVAAYLELHVEQGPVLERSGSRIGVVEAITGRIVLTLEIQGAAGHSGTTPMDARCDALGAAARVVLAAEHIARQRKLCRVATVGRLDPYPNTPNTIAGAVRMTVDLRDTDVWRAGDAEETLRAMLHDIAEATGTRIEVVAETRSDPVFTDPRLRETIVRSADELGLPHEKLPSGAGHDAQFMAGITPIGMIFVPSIGGVSHVPQENTAPEDLAAGARVLLRTALRTAGPQETL